MNDVRNGTEYRCTVSLIIISDPIFLYVAGKVLSKFYINYST